MGNLNENPSIRRDMMLLFEQSPGFQVRLKGTDFKFICRGVSWKENHVKSDYGNFHVELCELTGKTEDELNQTEKFMTKAYKYSGKYNQKPKTS